jgi:tetratricopeptide (TPR) repeat protein
MQITQRRHVNLKFVLGLLAAVAGLGVAVHFVNGFQVKRHAEALKRRAQEAEQDKDLPQAIQYLGRYLGFRPDDTESMATYGRLLDELGTAKKSFRVRQQAFAVLEEVLRREPGLHDLRRKQVDRAIALGDYGTAVAHAETLLRKDPGVTDPAHGTEQERRARAAELEQRIGLAQERRKQYADAEKAYERAIADAPGQLGNYLRLADLRRSQLNAPEKADELVLGTDEKNGMVEKIRRASGDKNTLFRAHLARASYCMRIFPGEKGERQEKLKKRARKDLDDVEVKGVALSGTPEEVDKILAEAEFARRAGDLAGATDILKAGLKAQPKDPRMCLELARLLAAEAKIEKIKDALEVIAQADQDSRYQGDLLHEKAELLILLGEREKVGQVIDQLRKQEYAPALVDYLEARLHMMKGEWGAGGQVLVRIRPTLTALNPRLETEANYLLGQCYDHLGNPDEAVVAYQAAVKSEPALVTPRLALLSALQALGRLPEALTEAKEVVQFDRRPADARLVVARLMTMINVRRAPEEKPNWTPVKGVLELAEKELRQRESADPDGKNPGAADVARVRAEVVVLQMTVLLLEAPKDPKEFGKVVDQVRGRLKEEINKARPSQIEFSLALAGLEGRENKDKEALKILQEAEDKLKKEANDSTRQARRADLHVARLTYLVRQPDEKARKAALADEEKVADGLTGEPRSRLLDALAEAYARARATADAERLLKLVAKENPTALTPRLELMDILTGQNKEAEVTELLADLRRLEGDLGTYWRYGEAARLVRQVRAQSKEGLSPAARSQLKEARGYLDEVASRRKGWPLAPALQGEIADLEGKPEVAVERYHQALALGDRRPLVIRRLVQHLQEQNRLAEIDKVVREELRGQEQALLLAGLGKQASVSLLGQGNREGAVEMAKQVLPADSKDYRDHLLLAQILYAAAPDDPAKAAKLFEEAGEHFRKACDLANGAPEPWVPLVRFLVETGRKEDALAAIKEASKAVAPDRSALTLANCHVLVGDLEEAERQFQAALAKQPDDRRVLRHVAMFYFGTAQAAKAEPLLRKLKAILEAAPEPPREDLAWVRRTLARVLTYETNESKFEEGQRLIGENLRANPNNPDDLHAQALLLATRMSQRKKAIRLLEELDKQRPLPAEERYTLFRLYEADGRWPEAQATMLVLLNSEAGRKDVSLRARYARRLIERGQPADLSEAERQLRLLREAQGPTQAAGALLAREIEARLLHARGQDDEAVAKLKEYAASKGVTPTAAALLFDELAQDAKKRPELYRKEAEELYKKYVQESKSPGRRLVLAGFYGRNGRVGEGLACCEEAVKDGAPPDAVGTVMTGLLRGEEKPTKEHVERVERWFAGAMAKDGAAGSLLLPLADLRDLQGNYPEAETLYLQVLNQNSKNLVAINNLAWLLALKEGKKSEALDLVNRGIQLVGRSPELLDTRGVIYVALGRADQAVKDLQDCIDQSPSAVRYFHLAQAHQLARDRHAAAEALRKARDSKPKLEPRQLHPLELKDYERLMADLS